MKNSNEYNYILLYSYTEIISNNQEYCFSEEKITKYSYRLFQLLEDVITFQFENENYNGIKGFDFELYEIKKSDINIKDTIQYKKLNIKLQLQLKIKSLKEDLKNYEDIMQIIQLQLKLSKGQVVKKYYLDQEKNIKSEINKLNGEIKELKNKLSEEV